jgi:hypothetical protein
MNKSILFASISAIVLLSSIQIAFAHNDNETNPYLNGRFDRIHGLAFNATCPVQVKPLCELYQVLYKIGFEN